MPSSIVEISRPSRAWVVVAIFAASILFAQIWKADLYDDPIIYAAVAKEMVRSGDWATPHWGPAPTFAKPPLIFWLTAVNFWLFGVNPVSAVFWSPALAVVAVVLLYFLGRRWFGEWVGIWAAVILATTPQFMKNSFTLRLDPPLTCFLLAAALATFSAAAGRPRMHLVAGAAIGLGLLTKGPVGALGFAPYAFLLAARLGSTRGGLPLRGWWKDRLAWGGLALALALPASWYLLMTATHGEHFLREAIWTEGLARAFRTGHDVSGWAYVKAIAYYYWPWLPPLILGLAPYVRRVRQEGWRWEGTFIACFCVAHLAILGAATEKFDRYLLPVYPYFALLAAVQVARWVPERNQRGVLRGLVVAAVAITGLTASLPLEIHRDRNAGARALAQELRGSREEVVVSEGAAEPNLLSALWYHGEFVPREMRPRYFDAPPPQGYCFRLLYRPEEEAALESQLELSERQSFSNDRVKLRSARACRLGLAG